MRLFTLYYTHKPGGFCDRLYRLAATLANEDTPFTFLTLDPESLKISKDVEVERIPFPITARKGAFFWLLFTTWAPAYLLWWSLRNGPCRAFVFNPYYAVLIAPSRFIGVVKHITCFYRSVGSRTYRARGKLALATLTSAIERLTYRCVDRVVTQTHTMHEQLSGGRPTADFDWHLLPNDMPTISPTEREIGASLPIVCIAVGKFDEGKNLSLLIRTFQKLPEEKFQLIVVGDGPVIPALQAEVQALSLLNVEFTGWVESVEQYYQKADLLLHPSKNEGMPNCILEAYSHYIGVLAADTPEMRELIEDPRLLFNPESYEELCSRLMSFLDQAEYRESVFKQGDRLRNSLSFNWEVNAKTILDYNKTQQG